MAYYDHNNNNNPTRSIRGSSSMWVWLLYGDKSNHTEFSANLSPGGVELTIQCVNYCYEQEE